MPHASLCFDVSGVQAAIDKGEFFLLYQPRFDLYRQCISSVEALVRWHDPQYGVVGPDLFIPALEKSGAIVNLGRWVLEESCRQAASWKAQGRPICVSVNLSPVQCRPVLLNELQDLLVRYGLQTSDIELEVTEGLFLSADCVQVLEKLVEAGFHIAVDDFGTGHSALFALRKFKARTIKIDKSFFNDVPGDLDACILLRAIITLGHSLGLKVVCEGVEDQDQLELAELFGADEIQGYVIARPMPASEVAHELCHTDFCKKMPRKAA
ncbi:MAG: EAL domain-containing protein [Terasakiella sp.]|uniref:EAL domain-containing protein n=1 Tax=unclassified Terasakiella TaxID=2614952 RepID=UPI003AFFE25C